MPDMEKVIKAIECCVVNHTRCFDDNDKLCPYFSTKVYMCNIELLKDALALLKEQEAVVRCNECKYYHKPEYGFTYGDCTYCSAWRQVSTDDFCSKGRRKDT